MCGGQGGVNDRARSHLSIWCLAGYPLFVASSKSAAREDDYAPVTPAIVIVYAFCLSLLGIFGLGCVEAYTLPNDWRCLFYSRPPQLFFSVQNVRMRIRSNIFINAEALPRSSRQHCVSRVVLKRRGGIRDGAELGTSERADFRYGKEGGTDFAKAHFLASNK
jgi:hypothetical protein